jgi:hypothetical protein
MAFGAAPLKFPKKGNQTEILQYGGLCLDDGQKFLERQTGYELIQPVIDRVCSKKTATMLAELDRPTGLATTSSNRMRKILLEGVAQMTDIKPFFEIKAYNSALEQTADNFSKLSTSWYTRVSCDQIGLAQCLRYAWVAGCGYVWLEWDPERQEIMPKAPDPRDVIPIRPDGEFISIQNSRGVIIREEYTVSHAKVLWPDIAPYLVQDHDALDGTALESTRAGRIYQSLNMKAGAPLDEGLFSSKPKASIGSQPAIYVYTMYIMDSEINKEKFTIQMGEFKDDPLWTKPDGLAGMFATPPQVPANNWSYEVKTGEKKYPRGRRIIFTRTAILEDIPNPYWFASGDLIHFPIVKLTLDPFPSKWFGLGPMWDLLPLQESLDWLLRVIDDHAAQVANPPVITNSMAMGKRALEAINTRRSGLKILANPMGELPVMPGVPALEPLIKEHVDWVKAEMDDLAGLSDLGKSLLSLNQLPNDETIERMNESKTYVLQARSRSIECFMREFATILISMFAQFYTIARRYRILGTSGAQPEDFDFDPNNLVPDYVDADDFDGEGNLTQQARDRGPLPVFDRYKEVQRQLVFSIAPGSLLNASSNSRKLLYLKGFELGLVSIWTLAKVLDIPGFGEPPAGATTEIEKLQAQQQMGIGPAAQQGRPDSYQSMPQSANNGGGAGSTVRTSK